MIRFRNPSSSLETMLASFEELYNSLKDKDYFDNDDIAIVLAKANLMASSGFTGDAALTLGANKDRSRDKTYNNAKMFAEIYRLLGLISVVNNVSSNYRFTYIGEHMVVPGADKKAIVEQCILGMNNPNKIMDVSYDESVRFFSCVLLSMSELDGIICRDEMILGPMNVNDNSPREYSRMIDYIKNLRDKKSFALLQSELEKMAKSLQGNKRDGMTVTSVQNCTRFPISVLKYCDWVESDNYSIYGKSVRFMKLTQHGYDTVNRLKTMKDIRLVDYEGSSEKEKRALIRLGTYQMLARAKFNLDPVKEELKEAQIDAKDLLGDKEILFSPYQTLEYSVVNKALNISFDAANKKDEAPRLSKYVKDYVKGIADKSYDVEINKEVNIKKEYVTKDVLDFAEHVRKINLKEKRPSKITEIIVEEHVMDKKTEFYPLVETLFRIIGVDCHKSRDGVNGERWDAMIRDPLFLPFAEIGSFKMVS